MSVFSAKIKINFLKFYWKRYLFVLKFKVSIGIIDYLAIWYVSFASNIILQLFSDFL